MTQRPDKEGKVLTQAIHVHASQNIIRSYIENFVNWNKKIKLPQEIQKIRQEIRNLDEKVSKMRPDIWLYRIEKNNVRQNKKRFSFKISRNYNSMERYRSWE
jgi:ERCC4-related helicase